MIADRGRHSLATDQTGRDHDPGVGLVEIRARGTEHGAAVLAGDQQRTFGHLAGGDVDELSAQSDRVRTPSGLLYVLH